MWEVLVMAENSNYPDGWEWLGDLPDEWEPPSEFFQPSSTIEYNLAIRMLAWDFLGRDFSAIIGRFITESSLFKLWYSQLIKGSRRSPKEQAALALAAWECTHRCSDAWQDLVEQVEISGRNFRERNVQNAFHSLREVLEEVIVQLQELREDVQEAD
ncbi:hypothetical protein HUT06_18680 [Actinomadura sp. NAK00032]|uniref:hypothetical protein n=1 Tax=Actinomadura sp. NAK00032 TaxID=2742128 RepID=UPI001590FB38|nr:hypothetical protein [Actinomadura sp. NAK00032]QKW35812.1 hypothetical protein HUT06_18680 [Actinomadura sp. NAK00032]